MTKVIMLSCLSILVLISSAAVEASSSAPSPVSSTPPISEVEIGASTPPAGAAAEIRKLMMGGSGGAEMFLPGCVSKELCSKNELLCFRACTAAVEEHRRDECPFKCVKCTPNC